jgi:hypothetical protein
MRAALLVVVGLVAQSTRADAEDGCGPSPYFEATVMVGRIDFRTDPSGPTDPAGARTVWHVSGGLGIVMQRRERMSWRAGLVGRAYSEPFLTGAGAGIELGVDWKVDVNRIGPRVSWGTGNGGRIATAGVRMRSGSVLLAIDGILLRRVKAQSGADGVDPGVLVGFGFTAIPRWKRAGLAVGIAALVLGITYGTLAAFSFE